MRLAIISGGSKGLGAALCDQYAARGFEVIEFSRSAPHPFSIKADFAAPQAALPAIEQSLAGLANRRWDDIVIVNNAATVGPIGPAARKDADAIAAHVTVNVTSGILFMARAMAAFQSHPCRKVLVNISSGAATKGFDGWSLYCASKAALENFIHSVALEQAREAAPFIAVNVSPGVIDTDMQQAIRAASKDDFPDVERFVGFKNSGALRAPAETAAIVIRIAGLPQLSGGATLNVSDYAT
jgi:benzil reductase ((S)-benzoin forming)